MTAYYHTPVLVNEVLRYLITDPNGIYVDGTLGGGGHAEEICRLLGKDGRLICFDADGDAIQFASHRLEQFSGRVAFVQANFGNLKPEISSLGAKLLSGVLLDLGVSSFQIDEESRGFSFRGDKMIDMRMDRRQAFSGWDVVNTYTERALADLLRKYGEEKNSRRIARRIVEARIIDSTGKLARTVEAVVGSQFVVKTLARVFQAIRIEVNDELGNLESGLLDSIELMAPGGRIVVISYHSIEDRIVKRTFKDASLDRIPSGNKYVPDAVATPRLRVLTKSPIVASGEEIDRNPRARSAKLRAAERITT